MYMDFDKFRRELLKTHVARIARGSLTEDFPKSGHIWRIYETTSTEIGYLISGCQEEVAARAKVTS